jgi:2-pyrone-4,6-dicarboxylate lactonase
VRFNFVKRLVDFTPPRRARAIAARIAPLGWHIVVYFEMPDSARARSLFHSLATAVVVDHMGRPDCEEGPRSSGVQALPHLLDKHANIWSK